MPPKSSAVGSGGGYVPLSPDHAEWEGGVMKVTVHGSEFPITCCYMLDDIRTRSKLIEVGGAASVAMMIATVAVGLINMDPLERYRRDLTATKIFSRV